jgi:hypothetical protein
MPYVAAAFFCTHRKTRRRNSNRLVCPDVFPLAGELLDPRHVFSCVAVSALNDHQHEG